MCERVCVSVRKCSSFGERGDSVKDVGRRYDVRVHETAGADRGVLQGSRAVLRSAGTRRQTAAWSEKPARQGARLPLRHPPGTVRRRTRHWTRSMLPATHHGKPTVFDDYSLLYVIPSLTEIVVWFHKIQITVTSTEKICMSVAWLANYSLLTELGVCWTHLRLRVWYTSRSLQRRRRTCPPTFHSSPSMVVLISAHLPTGYRLFHRQAPVSMPEDSLLRDRACGTPYRLIYNRWPTMDSLGDMWKHIYSGPRNHGVLWLFFALCKYTYLLTCTQL